MLRQAQTDFRIAAAIQVGDFGFYKDLLRRRPARSGSASRCRCM